MIVINGKQYNNYDIKVLWGNFNVSDKNGKKINGRAPFITFCLEKNISLGIEFTFSKVMFLNTKINVKENINEYITDIIFENGNGWKSLDLEKYDCNITRINEKTFNLNLAVKEDNLFINTNIDLF